MQYLAETVVGELFTVPSDWGLVNLPCLIRTIAQKAFELRLVLAKNPLAELQITVRSRVEDEGILPSARGDNIRVLLKDVLDVVINAYISVNVSLNNGSIRNIPGLLACDQSVDYGDQIQCIRVPSLAPALAFCLSGVNAFSERVLRSWSLE